VWVSIEWFYSPQDAVELNKELSVFIPFYMDAPNSISSDPSHCGKYERLKSNHTDCVSSHCFDGISLCSDFFVAGYSEVTGLVPVKQYDETNLDQESIGGEEFYYRYTANISDKSIFVSFSLLYWSQRNRTHATTADAERFMCLRLSI
jgi:hypothetical protein